VADVLGCATADVRALVVEEKRLPAVYVTLVGAVGVYAWGTLIWSPKKIRYELGSGLF